MVKRRREKNVSEIESEKERWSKRQNVVITVKYYCYTKAIYDAFHNHYTFLYYKFIYMCVCMWVGG